VKVQPRQARLWAHKSMAPGSRGPSCRLPKPHKTADNNVRLDAKPLVGTSNWTNREEGATLLT